MPWDADSTEDAYIDYLAEHESGFMGGLPVRLVGMDDAIEMMANEVGATHRVLTPSDPGARPRFVSHHPSRRLKAMAKRAAAPKTSAAPPKKISKADKKIQRKIAKLEKRQTRERTKRDKKIASLQAKIDKLMSKTGKK